jgi:hypothetical protein
VCTLTLHVSGTHAHRRVRSFTEEGDIHDFNQERKLPGLVSFVNQYLREKHEL